MKSFAMICLLFASPCLVSAESIQPLQVQIRTDEEPADAWRSLQLSRVDPQRGLIWLRLSFVVPPLFGTEETPILYVAAPVAYEVWWNGVYVGRNGTPGRSKADEAPGRIDSTVPVPISALRSGLNDAVLRMSSHHLPQRLNAPMQTIELRESRGAPGEPPVQHSLRMLAAGVLLLGIVYFGGSYLSDRKERSSLLLALLALAVLGQLVAESLRWFYNYLYPFHVVRLQLILAFAAASAVLLIIYVTHRYARSYERALLAGIGLLICVSVLLPRGFDLKTSAVLIAGLTVSCVAAGIGLRRGTPGAGFAIASLAVTLIIALADLSRFIDQTYYLAIVVLLVVLFAQQLAALRRAQKAQAEAQLRTARLELELLRQQIRPHFMMNTLTALCEWIESDPATGVKMIEALGDEMRALSAIGDAQAIPLGQEIKLCRRHLRVMGFRRNRSFTLDLHGVDPAAPVPPTLLHTLIENSLTHNLHPDGAQFVLAESADENGRRRYELRSPLQARRRTSGTGMGHTYVRARLQHAFGDEWHFSAGPSGSEWIDRIETPRHVGPP